MDNNIRKVPKNGYLSLQKYRGKYVKIIEIEIIEKIKTNRSEEK